MTEIEEGLLDGNSLRKASWEFHVTANIVLSSSVAACGYFAYGFAAVYASPAQSGIMDDLGLSIEEYSGFASIMTFGGMTGALISGKVADIFGRRVTMWLLDLFFILGWCSITFGKRAWWLDAGRFLMGVGAGIQLYVLFSVSFTMGMGGTPWIIMSEILPINIKGSAGSLTTLVNCFTSWIVSYAFNFLFQWNAAGIFFLFAFFCGSVVVFVAMLVPEMKGRTLGRNPGINDITPMICSSTFIHDCTFCTSSDYIIHN